MKYWQGAESHNALRLRTAIFATAQRVVPLRLRLVKEVPHAASGTRRGAGKEAWPRPTHKPDEQQ